MPCTDLFMGLSFIILFFIIYFLANTHLIFVLFVLRQLALNYSFYSTCPAKAHFWKSLIFEFLWPTVTIPVIIEAIYTMNFYKIRYSQKSKALSYMIVIIAMADICGRLIFSRFSTNPFSSCICISQHPLRHPPND